MAVIVKKKAVNAALLCCPQWHYHSRVVLKELLEASTAKLFHDDPCLRRDERRTGPLFDALTQFPCGFQQKAEGNDTTELHPSWQ